LDEIISKGLTGDFVDDYQVSPIARLRSKVKIIMSYMGEAPDLV
jgi:hypothetical protein